MFDYYWSYYHDLCEYLQTCDMPCIVCRMAVEEEKDSLEVLHTQQQATLITLRANLQEERTRTPQTQHTKWHQLSSVCLWFVVTCLVL